MNNNRVARISKFRSLFGAVLLSLALCAGTAAAGQAPVTVVSIRADRSAPLYAGDSVRWTVAADGPEGLQYAFYLHRDAELIQTRWFDAQNHLDYSFPEPGEYWVRAAVRGAGGALVYGDSAVLVVREIPLQITALVPDRQSPQWTRRAVRWTVTAHGPPGLQYAFYIYRGLEQAHFQGFSGQDYVDYTTSLAGNYRVKAQVKTASGLLAERFSDVFVFEQRVVTIPVRIVQDFIPAGRLNRPGFPMDPVYVTIHDTANRASGANARMHSLYLKNTPGLIASWHFTVDSVEIYQHLPLNENGWHAGDGKDGPGNRTSIGIEICENSDGNRAIAESHAAWLTAKLLLEQNIPLANIRQHYDWDGKNCPNVLRGRPGGWLGFIADVSQKMKQLDTK